MAISPITSERNRGALPKDLERYCQLAVEFGASKARVVAAADVPVEDAVAFKCRVPQCYGFNNCGQCPPHAPKPSEIRELLKSYSHSVLFVRNVSAELLKRERTDKERRAAFRSILEVVSKLESAAFYDGHYLAVGFSAGSCFGSLCDSKLGCQMLKGDTCRFPLIARPSMEAVGIDVYRMVAASGWEIYPYGSNATPEDIPTATLAGLVMVQ